MPVYNISGVKSTASPLTPQRTPGADAFGAGLAKGLSTVGDIYAQREFDLKQEEDETRAREMDVQYSQAMMKALHDPETGYFVQKGRNAMDAFAKTQEALEKARRDIAANATNETQRKLFDKAATARSLSGQQAMSQHAARETVTWKNEVDAAASVQALDMAVANRHDDKIIRQNMQAGLFSQGKILDRAGVTGEAKQVALEKWETDAHAAVIDGLVKDENFDGAQAYYQKNMGRIDGTARPGLEQKIAGGRREKVGQQAADMYLASGMTEREAIADARKKFSGKDEDEVVTRLKTRFAEDRQTKKLAEEGAYDAALKIITAPGGKKADIPAEVWEAMDGKSRAAINKAEADRLSPKERKTDPAKYAEVYQRLDDGDIRNEAQLAKYLPYLSTSDYKAASDALRGQGTVKEGDLKSAYLKMAGKTKMDDSDLEDYVQFTNYVRDRVSADKQSDYDDIETHAARWYTEGKALRPGLFGPSRASVTFGEAYTEGELHQFTMEAPDDLIPRINTVRQLLGETTDAAGMDAFYSSKYYPAVEELRRRGKLVTPETTATAIKLMMGE